MSKSVKGAGARDAKVPSFIALGLFMVLLFVSSGLDRSEGGVHYLLTQQILLRHRISFDAPVFNISLLAPNGRYYLMHEAGNSLYMLPTAGAVDAAGAAAEAAGRPFNTDQVARLAVTFGGAAYVALSCAALYVIARGGFGVAPRVAFAGAVLAAFGSQLLGYSDNLFDGVVTGTCLTFVIAFAVLARKRTDARFAALSGIAMGMSLITRETAVLAIPGLVVFLWPGTGGRRRLLGLVLAMLPFVTWQAFYNYVRTGSPLVSPEILPVAHNPFGLGLIPGGAAGLLASPSKSILVYTPLLLLVPLGVRRAWSRNRALTLLLGWVVLSYLAVIAGLEDWAGAFGWGPRHFVVVVPAAMVLVAVALDRPRRQALTVTASVLAALGFAINLPAIIANWNFRLAAWRQAHDGALFPIWDPMHSQWLYQWQGMVNNVAYMLGQAAPANVDGYYAPQALASNTVNVWWLTATEFGLPPWLAAAVAACLLATGVVLLRAGWRQLPRALAS